MRVETVSIDIYNFWAFVVIQTMAVNLKIIYLVIFQMWRIIMHQFWFDLLTTMTFVAVTSSIQQVLDNTAEKSDWIWIIREPQLPSRASGVSLNASFYYDVL